MQHADFRRLFAANPRRSEPDVLAHRHGCAECARYADDLEKLDQRVPDAPGEVPVPAAAPPSAPPSEIEALRADHERRGLPRWYALAATVLLTLFVGLVWTATSRDRATLIADILEHAEKDRGLFVESTKRVENSRIEQALKKAGAERTADLPVSIARICKVRGHVAPHLIIQTRDGPVHAIVLPEERFWRSHSFAQDGYRGKLVPQGKHAFALVGTSEAAVEEAAELAKKGIDWQK